MSSEEHTFTFTSPARGAETVEGMIINVPPGAVAAPVGAGVPAVTYQEITLGAQSVCDNGTQGCDNGLCDYCRYGRCSGCGCDGLNCMGLPQCFGPVSFEGHFRELHDGCLRIMVDRQRKYGPSNIPKFGPFGTLVRLNDKIERLNNLAKNGRLEDGDFDDETVEDTLIDISNYANIIRAQLAGWWTSKSCPPLEEAL